MIVVVLGSRKVGSVKIDLHAKRHPITYGCDSSTVSGALQTRKARLKQRHTGN